MLSRDQPNFERFLPLSIIIDTQHRKYKSFQLQDNVEEVQKEILIK